MAIKMLCIDCGKSIKLANNPFLYDYRPICVDCTQKKLKTAYQIAIERTNTVKKLKHSDLKYIDKIGIELEGGWDSNVGRSIYTDHSVRVPNAPYRGEIQTKPSTLELIEDFVAQHHPRYIDDSCGLHIHVSFKDKIASFLTLMEKDFWTYFQPKMEQWGKDENIPTTHAFWHRLRGDNRFCRKVFQPERQIHLVTKDDQRYTQLNFCYAMHGTIECRLFPGFSDPNKIMSATYALISCYEEYLDKNLVEVTKTFSDTVYEYEFME